MLNEMGLIEAAFEGRLDSVKEHLKQGTRIDARYGGDGKRFQNKKSGGWPMAGRNDEEIRKLLLNASKRK